MTKHDFGIYHCYAVNAYNVSKATVELKEIELNRPNLTKSTVSKIFMYNNNENSRIRNQYDLNDAAGVGSGLSLHYSDKNRLKSNGTSRKIGDTSKNIGDEEDYYGQKLESKENNI